MRPRSELHGLLEALMGKDQEVYFQPPESVKMVYPCIVYKRYSGRTHYANDMPYAHAVLYQITVIDKDPDGTLREAVAMLPTARFETHFVADNLHHDVYQVHW